MSDIRKRTGAKGTTYQVRYPRKAAKSGYAYATFDTMKEARAFIESGKARDHDPLRRSDVAPQFYPAAAGIRSSVEPNWAA